jgi:hypothetical protein
VSYFGAVRLYSLIELCVFTALVVVWAGGLGDRAQLILGWTHGVGWLALCAAVWLGCVRRLLPWPVLAAAVSPLGPLGSTVALEFVALQRRRAAAGRA